MSTPIGLDNAQLHEVTGCKQNGKQIEALVEMVIPFRVRPDGSPFVCLADISKSQDSTKSVEIHEPVLTLIE
jgi:hypothetical protein